MPRHAINVGSVVTAPTTRRPPRSQFRVVVFALALTTGLASTALAFPAPPASARGAPSANLIAVCVNGDPWLDGGFEATDPVTLLNPNYVVSSTLFPSSLCNLANSLCTDGEGPRSGSSWFWGGGNDLSGTVAEIDTAEQSVTIPTGASSVTLSFYLRIGYVTAPFTDTLEVQVDGVTQQTYVEPSTAESSYTLRSVDLTAFADGAAHAVMFRYTQHVSGAINRADFNVDDISLDIVCTSTTPTATATSTSTPTRTRTPTPTPPPTLTPTPTRTRTPTPPPTLTPTPTPTRTPTPTLTPTPTPTPGAQVLAIEPDSGSASGGTPVVVSGTGFQGGATLTIGGAAATGVVVVGPTQIDAFTPPLPAGTLNDVTVTNPTTFLRPHAPRLANASLPSGWLADFLDVPQANNFHDFVEKVFRHAITVGYGDGYYGINDPVTRAQMAVLLLKTEHGPSHVPPPCTGIFSDVECSPTPAFAVDWIEQLFHEGITVGCLPAGHYCPDDLVTRAEMAVLLLKTEHGIAWGPPLCAGIFQDVECTPMPAFAVDWIEQLHNEGATVGCSLSPLKYCADNPNTRGEMAVFLTKTFGLQ
jgi:hypothetical protein